MACLTGWPQKKGVMYVALSELSTTTAQVSDIPQGVPFRSELQSDRAWSYSKADEGRTNKPSNLKYSKYISMCLSITFLGWQGRMGSVIEKSSQQNPVVFLGISNRAINSSSILTYDSNLTVTPLTLFFSQMSLVSSRMPSSAGPKILLPVLRSMAMKLSQTREGTGVLALPMRMEQLPLSMTILLLLSSRQAIIIYTASRGKPHQTKSYTPIKELCGQIQKKWGFVEIIYYMQQVKSNKYIAVIIAEVKSTARELYPLTKNYPMALLSIGPKKLIVYQLQALLNVPQLQKVIVVGSEQQKQLQDFIQGHFAAGQRGYPHKVEFRVAKDIANTTLALKDVLAAEKELYSGYIIQHADTINDVSLREVISFHQLHHSEATLIVKPKRELGEQEKKLPEGELQAEIDNILIGENGECLFLDMMEELENEGVKIDPSIFKQVRRASFRRIVDSRTYIFGPRVIRILKNLNHEQVYEIKPFFIQLLVKNQTNTRLISLDEQSDPASLKPLKIFVHMSEQNTYIRKIASKKIYEAINFDSIIRGPKQKDVLIPSSFSDKLDQRKQFKGNANVSESATIGGNAKIRRSCIGAGCKIGKNVEILNSILMENVQLKDNCKVIESVLGSGCSMGEGVSIKSTYAQAGCRVADGGNIESQVLIRMQ